MELREAAADLRLKLERLEAALNEEAVSPPPWHNPLFTPAADVAGTLCEFLDCFDGYSKKRNYVLKDNK